MTWAELPFPEEGMDPTTHLKKKVRLGYYQDTLVVVETQIPLRVLATLGPHRGFGYLESVKGDHADHFDVIYSPGHWGLTEPHYDFREYLVEHADHQTFECQPAGKGGWFQFIEWFN